MNSFMDQEEPASKGVRFIQGEDEKEDAKPEAKEDKKDAKDVKKDTKVDMKAQQEIHEREKIAQ